VGGEYAADLPDRFVDRPAQQSSDEPTDVVRWAQAQLRREQAPVAVVLTHGLSLVALGEVDLDDPPVRSREVARFAARIAVRRRIARWSSGTVGRDPLVAAHRAQVLCAARHGRQSGARA
jgi:hypothetical protein